MSTQGPKSEKLAIESLKYSVAPTVIADGAAAGETPQASLAKLPAITTTCIPASVRFLTNEFTASEMELDCIDMLTTVFVVVFFCKCSFKTYAIPNTRSLVVPEFCELSTLTATSLTFLATPKVL